MHQKRKKKLLKGMWTKRLMEYDENIFKEFIREVFLRQLFQLDRYV